MPPPQSRSARAGLSNAISLEGLTAAASASLCIRSLCPGTLGFLQSLADECFYLPKVSWLPPTESSVVLRLIQSLISLSLDHTFANSCQSVVTILAGGST